MLKSFSKILTILFFVSTLFPQRYVTHNNIDNPCEDSEFINLKSKDINEMSDREYEYFMLKSKECADYNNSLILNKPQEEQNKIIEKGQDRLWTYILVSGLVTFAIYTIASSDSPDSGGGSSGGGYGGF